MVFIEFTRHCGCEFSDVAVILASLIAVACLCSDEQLKDRVTGGENNIDFHYLAFLIAFAGWPVGFGGIYKTKDDCCYQSEALDQDPMHSRCAVWGSSQRPHVQSTLTAAAELAAREELIRNFNGA